MRLLEYQSWKRSRPVQDNLQDCDFDHQVVCRVGSLASHLLAPMLDIAGGLYADSSCHYSRTL